MSKSIFIHVGKLRWLVYPLMCTTVITAALVAVGFHHVYFDRTNLPDIEPFARFEFPAIGCVYDTKGLPLIELAKEYRRITKYEDLPPVVRDAIVATEDKNFFSHSGIDYSTIPRVLSKVRIGALVSHLTRSAGREEVNSGGIFPQGGSTITQQLVRGHFLQKLTAQENSKPLLHRALLLRGLSSVIGPRSVNKLFRKLEEMRLSLWVEEEMQKRFGSKRRAKEEILARYASFVYVGNGQYGIARAAEYYLGRPIATFTVDDADKVALLAGIAKSPRSYAPTARETKRILRRRNQILALMAANGFISPERVREAEQRPIQVVARQKDKVLQAAAVVENVLQELKAHNSDLSAEDLQQGRIHVYSTVDARVQKIMNEALEHGLELYERRHPSSKGLIQGAVIVLKNRDASVLAEAGGRQFHKGRSASYSDFNRVTQSLRQPGSAMKPIVYLTAFRQGTFTLDSMVPDEPIGVNGGGEESTKWISNYDGQFKGVITLREALAESSNAVAVWVTEQIGIDSVLRTSRSLGIHTPLQPYASTALGASEVNLLELANAYRVMASGILTQPYVIRKIVRASGEVEADKEGRRSPFDLYDDALSLSLIQEGLRGVVRISSGTAHALDSRGFPIAVMGKTGTTNEFRDALFIGSTYGPEGITIAVRIGFDDNRSLGPKETGGRVALPVFKEIMLRVYREKLAGPVPEFPAQMEQNINAYLKGDSAGTAAGTDIKHMGRPEDRRRWVSSAVLFGGINIAQKPHIAGQPCMQGKLKQLRDAARQLLIYQKSALFPLSSPSVVSLRFQCFQHHSNSCPVLAHILLFNGQGDKGIDGAKEQRRTNMNAARNERHVSDEKELRDAIRRRWGVLTDKDLDAVDERLERLPGLLQARYGYTRKQAEKEIDQFLSSMKPEGANPVEVVRETLADSTPEEEAHVGKRVYKNNVT